MKTLKEIASFLEDHIIECDPKHGCQRCNEARECVNSLKFMIQEADDEIDDDAEVEVEEWKPEYAEVEPEVEMEKVLSPCDSCEAPDLDYCYTCKHSYPKQASNDKDNNTS